MPVPPHRFRTLTDEEKTKPWVCSKCGYTNLPEDEICDYCFSFRPMKISLGDWRDSDGRVY